MTPTAYAKRSLAKIEPLATPVGATVRTFDEATDRWLESLAVSGLAKVEDVARDLPRRAWRARLIP